jgi:transcriptional regulator with XRE-family HTH domain
MRDPAHPFQHSALLPDTLARRVQVLREQLDMTARGLAKKAGLPEAEVQDIEQGLTLFLSPHMRQLLAKALRVRPDVLEAVEKPFLDMPMQANANDNLSPVVQLAFMEQVINQPHYNPPCPRCGKVLTIQRFIRQDMHGNPIHAVKIRCGACWLKLDHG